MTAAAATGDKTPTAANGPLVGTGPSRAIEASRPGRVGSITEAASGDRHSGRNRVNVGTTNSSALMITIGAAVEWRAVPRTEATSSNSAASTRSNRTVHLLLLEYAGGDLCDVSGQVAGAAGQNEAGEDGGGRCDHGDGGLGAPQRVGQGGQ